MILEKVGNEKYLITISKKDIKILNSSLEQMQTNNKYDGKIKQITKKLFSKFDLTKFLQSLKNEFNVKVFNKEDTYTMLISKIINKNISYRKVFILKKEVTPYVFKFEEIEDFIKTAKILREKKLLLENSLLRYKGSYFLVLYFEGIVFPSFGKVILTEHSTFFGKGWTAVAKVLEFGEKIMSDAINAFSKNFD